MKTLLIDTSHERSLIAFADGVDIILKLSLPFGLQSSSHLFPTLRSGFQKLSLSPEDLEAVCVTVGPGSFTGIRVGVAAAKGIAAPKGLALLSVCSLIGFMGGQNSAALIDARGGRGFVRLPGWEGGRLVSREELPRVLEGCEQIVGPHLKHFNFSGQVEREPNPTQLLKGAVVVNDLELTYPTFDF